MAVHWVPENKAVVSTVLAAKNARGLADFVVRVLDVKLGEVHSDAEGVLRHSEAQIGGACVMIAEACAPHGPQTAAFYVYVPDVDATHRRAVAAGATSLSEPATQFYGDRHAGVRDAWGNMWYFATHVEDVPPAEMERRAQEHMKKHPSK